MKSWALKCWEKWIIFNSNEIKTEIWNSECKKTDDNKSILCKKSHDLLYSSISSWEDYCDFWR